MTPLEAVVRRNTIRHSGRDAVEREEGAAPGYGQGDPDAALYPEMLGRRRTQAGVIIRTDSQRNVSRGNRVGWAIFRGQAPHPIFEIFATPRAIRMGPIGGKHRSVRVGTPATHSGATIPAGGKPSPVGTPYVPAQTRRLVTEDGGAPQV